MGSWQELVSIAVVGTERRGVPSGIPADIAAIMEGQVRAGNAEEQVLVAAGVLGAWRRAGEVAPATNGPLPEPAPDDGRPPASGRAVQLLELLLDGHADVGAASTDLVADWLVRCTRSGHRPPAGTLPRILDAATATTALRDPAVAAGGPTLRWLAARNPAWAWASGTGDLTAEPEQVWAGGARDDRLAALAALRARDPARGRAMLEETWTSESAADRTRFVESLATGLSLDDEPFLESVLDDRSKTVRAAAATLLASLPDSALARRMTDRLRPLVRRERSRLSAKPPDEIDAAAMRDGIVVGGAPPGTGRRAWALRQIIAATPLAFWEQELARGPEGIVDLGGGDLLAGWELAAARQGNTAWARQLLRHRPTSALLAALPPELAHGELEVVLPRVDDQSVGQLLAATPPPWPAATSHAVVARLRSAESRQTLLSALPVLATALDPVAMGDVEAWAESLRVDDPARTRLRSLILALSLRMAIAGELT